MKIFITLITAVLLSVSGCKNNDNTEKLVVASRLADCTGVAPQKCMLIKRDGSADWEFWYGGIEGFDYQPGYEYVISVERIEQPNPPADASSVRYKLKKIISRVETESEGIPTLPLVLPVY